MVEETEEEIIIFNIAIDCLINNFEYHGICLTDDLIDGDMKLSRREQLMETIHPAHLASFLSSAKLIDRLCSLVISSLTWKS